MKTVATMKHALGLEPQLTLGLTARSPAGGGFQALASLSTSTTVKVLCVGWQLDHSAGESHVALMCVQGRWRPRRMEAVLALGWQCPTSPGGGLSGGGEHLGQP